MNKIKLVIDHKSVYSVYQLSYCRLFTPLYTFISTPLFFVEQKKRKNSYRVVTPLILISKIKIVEKVRLLPDDLFWSNADVFKRQKN
jgi:hypothetical protein